MKDFPEFMKNAANRIAPRDQHTPGIVGYVFDGADGSQMAFWTYNNRAQSAAHAHKYDEYFIVVQGSYTIEMNGKRTIIRAGKECFIPRGTVHSGESSSGTRTIHAFGGHRADREQM